MAKGISKNSRRNVTAQKFIHTCGGEIKMVTRFKSGKMKNVAVCEKCNAEAGKPSLMTLQK